MKLKDYTNLDPVDPRTPATQIVTVRVFNCEIGFVYDDGRTYLSLADAQKDFGDY